MRVIEVIVSVLGYKHIDVRVVDPDEPDAPDYSLVDPGRSLRDVGSLLMSLVRGRWGDNT